MSEFDIGTRYFPYNIAGIINQATPLPITYPNVGKIVGTTTSTTITGGQVNTVTVPAGTNIAPNMKLHVKNGATVETIQVVTVPSTTTFTAFFVNSYSGTTNLNSTTASLLGHVIINTAGTGATLTLWNGFSGGNPGGVKIATITVSTAEQTRPYYCFVEFGLFYTLASTGAPDITVMYRDDPQNR